MAKKKVEKTEDLAIDVKTIAQIVDEAGEMNETKNALVKMLDDLKEKIGIAAIDQRVTLDNVTIEGERYVVTATIDGSWTAEQLAAMQKELGSEYVSRKDFVNPLDMNGIWAALGKDATTFMKSRIVYEFHDKVDPAIVERYIREKRGNVFSEKLFKTGVNFIPNVPNLKNVYSSESLSHAVELVESGEFKVKQLRFTVKK